MNRKIFIIIAIVIFAIVVSLIYSISILIEPKNTIISTIDNTTKKYTAYVFERNAGATTDYSTQISILKSNKILNNSSGNIFIADRGKAQLSEFGIINIDIVWKDQNTLVIKYDRKARIFLKKEKYENINIIYAEQ